MSSRPTQQILRHLYRHGHVTKAPSFRATRMGVSTNVSVFTQRTRSRSMVTITKTKVGEMSDPINVTTTTATSNPTPPTTTTSNEEEVIITSSCAARIKQLSKSRSESDLYLRIYVDAGGCSGFQYKFNLESNDPSSPSYNAEDGGIDPDEDVVFVKDDERVVIDQSSLDFLKGSTVDYVQEMIKSSFEVRENPNSENACGCGSSFAVKKFELNPALD